MCLKTKLICGLLFFLVCKGIGQCPNFQVQDKDFCGNVSATLTASNASSTCPFKWYQDQTSEKKLGEGCSFSTPVLSCNRTYYVEDTATIIDKNLVAGYSIGQSPLSGNGSSGQWTSSYFVTTFDTDAPTIINSIRLKYKRQSFSCSGSYIIIRLKDANGTITTYPLSPGCGSDTRDEVIPVNFSVSKGEGHEIRISKGSNLVFYHSSGADYSVGGSLDYPEGLRITGNGQGGNAYGGLYDWDVTIKDYCDRVPVKATQICALTEICNNGIDDDCDGLIDCFDPDCKSTFGACGSFYFGQEKPACQIIPNVDPNFGLEEVWRSDKAVETRGTPAVGDIDGDGVPEVVAYNTGDTRKYLYVFSGLDGTTEVEMNPEINAFSQSASIVDADLDGLGEIYIVDEFRNLLCYENDGTPKAGFLGSKVGRGKAGTNAPDNSYHPAFADFDADGVPEIYIANQIFNSLTGALIAEPIDPDNSSKGGPGASFPAHAYPAAWDVLPDDFCSDCSGTELICGNTVYSVNVASGTLTAVSTAPAVSGAASGLPDGKVALADWNGDGKMDIVISASCCGWGGSIYIWDPRKEEMIAQDAGGNPLVGNPVDAQPSANTNTGNPSIADFDGDGLLEIAYAANDEYVVLDNDLSVKWTRAAVDESNQTTSTAFDFEGDGKTEVVYRDENVLYILNGETGAVKAQTPCGSGTRTEQPIVVDVDGDGDAEIVCNCADNDQGGQGQVRVFHSNTNEWVNTRRVWHQHNYTPVYVNDDLTIPRNFQNKALLAKQDLFFAQSPVVDIDGNPIFTGLPDIEAVIDSVVFSDCIVSDSGTAYLSVCNSDLNALVYDFDISAYRGNPKSGGSLINVTSVQNVDWTVQNTRCIQVPIKIPNDNYTLFTYVNDDGTDPTKAPVKTFDECDLTNNVSSIPVNCNKTCTLPSKKPLLIPDSVVSVCDLVDESITSSSEEGYYFSWYKNGIAVTTPTLNDSVYNAQSEGKYTVRVAGSPSEINNPSCYLQSDTIQFILSQTPDFTLGNDTTICEGDSVTFGAQIVGASYSWNTGHVVNEIIADTSGEYILSLEINGCVARDTIELMLEGLPIVDLGNDTSLCDGNSLLLDAGNVGLVHLWNTGSMSQTISVSTSGDYGVKVTSSNGCETVDTVSVVFNPVPVVDLGKDTSICFGDSLLLDAGNAGFDYAWNTLETNQFIRVDTSGEYIVTVSGGGVGCLDSDTIDVIVNSLPVVDLGNDTSLCDGNSLLLDAGNVGLVHLWNTGSMSQTISVSTSGDYGVKVTSSDGCEAVDTVSVVFNPVPVVDLGKDTSICFGDSLLLDAGNAGFNSAWNTLETNQFIKVDTSGEYIVTVSGGGVGCLDSDTIDMIVNSLPVVDLGSDTTICFGDSLSLNAGNVGMTHSWNNGADSQTIFANSEGVYWVQVENPMTECVGIDSLFLSINTPDKPVLSGLPADACEGDDLINLTVIPSGTILSGVGVSGNVFDPKNSSVVLDKKNWIRYKFVNSDGCVSEDSSSIRVHGMPIVNQSVRDTSICLGRKVELSVSSFNTKEVQWFKDNSLLSGNKSNENLVAQAGEYFVKASNEWCTVYSDTVAVYIESPNGVIKVGASQLKEGDFTDVTVANPNEKFNYLWIAEPFNDINQGLNVTSFKVAPSVTTTYFLKTSLKSDPSCFVTEKITVVVVGNVLPDQVFSPGNGDGVNDYWRIVNLNKVSYPNNLVKVYNRWGTLVYEGRGYSYNGIETLDDDTEYWDGMYNGSLLPVGTYYYVIELNDGSGTTLSGSVSIVR